MMRRTVLNTPVLTPCLRAIAVFMAWACRWKIPNHFPQVPKAILIGAPHTSNWDFFLMLMTVLVCRLDLHWVGKHTLFVGVMGPIMRWLGGIPIDRSNSVNFVDQIVEHFNQHERLWLVIAPEGTRKPVEKWRTGFYFMAYQAAVPIVLSFLDYKHKRVGVASVEVPTGNADEDIAKYQAFYATITGKNPYNYHGYCPEK